jgi:hypothetical protein
MYSMELSRAVKKTWNPIADTVLAYKDMRCIYGGIALSLYKPSGVSVNAYLSSIFGHGENDVSTANSYTKFELVV